jgi:polysaccharide deacetylase 2 family uncharacterized protein YibQ
LGEHAARFWFSALAALALTSVAAAQAEARKTPPVVAEIAIIIDDLGQQRSAGLRAIRLPGPVALAFLPQTEHAAVQAELAHGWGKEVLLHLPLEPAASSARAHPTAIRASAGREALQQAFAAALASVPHARGVNNHQGSLLTGLPEPMGWLMEALRAHPQLYFVDSRTSSASVAYRTARRHGIPATERNVFLDDERSESAIREQFRRLVARALKDERALAIGHPYPETLTVLEEELPLLASRGIQLVPPSLLIARQGGDRRPAPSLKLSPALTLATSLPPPKNGDARLISAP